ncbi:helix-turn-helix transcriptional regulator [Enterococcus hirae]
MNIADNIKRLRKNHGYTQKDLANILRVKPTAISAWESGRNKPLMDKVTIMATLFGVSTSEIVGDTFNKDSSILSLINATSSKLDPPRQQKVYDFAKNELEEQRNRNKKNSNKKNNLSISEAIDNLQDEPTETVDINLIAAAGHGTLNFEKDKPIETVVLPQNNIPEHYDYACKISGNSMEPMFHNGEIIFLKKVSTVKNNMIAAIEINKECFLKKLTLDHNRLRLISLNNKTDDAGNLLYPDIFAKEGDDIYIIGEVIR